MAMSTPSTQGNAGLSYAIGAAVAGLTSWGLSLCHVVLPAEQASAIAFLVGVGVHHFFGPKMITATGATAVLTPVPKAPG